MNTQDNSKAQSVESMAQDYLKGELTPEEQVSFEEYLMEHPDLLENLQIDNLFVKTLPEVDVPLKKPTDSPRREFRMSWLSSLSMLGLGAVGAYASFFIMSLFNTPTTNMRTLESVVYVETMRSVNSETVSATLPLSTGNIGLMIAADFDQPGPFKVTISNFQTQGLIAEIDNVNKTENEDLAVILDTQLFAKGLYLIETTDYKSGKQNGLIIEFVSPSKKIKNLMRELHHISHF